MLPHWHIILGAIFSIIVFSIFPSIGLTGAVLIFLSSVLIDVDHYLYYAVKNNNWSLFDSYKWYKARPKHHKPMFHLLHTIEFIFLLSLFILIFKPFFFILIGILVHSYLDISDMIYFKALDNREFSFSRYIISDKKNYL